jgi:hypothetical protein
MSWSRFVAFVVFLAMSWVWMQWRRGRGLAGTAVGMIGFLAAMWLVLRLWRRWRAAAKAAGCPGRILHDFRRTAVRNLNRAGVPETVAMKITGHKTRSVFDRYDITSEEDLAEPSRKLQALVGTISGTTAKSDAEALKDAIAKSVKGKTLQEAVGGTDSKALRFVIGRSARTLSAHRARSTARVDPRQDGEWPLPTFDRPAS